MTRFRLVTATGAVFFALSASADIDQRAFIFNVGTDADGNCINRVYLLSDDPTDQLLAINGDFDHSPLSFWSSGSSLVNRGGPYANGDRMRPPFVDSDSYLTIGDDYITANTAFSPGFLGTYASLYSPAAVVGSSFSQADNGGYFDGNPTTPVHPDAEGRFMIAQLILPAGNGPTFFYGTARYVQGSSGSVVERSFWSAVESYCIGDAIRDGDVGFSDLTFLLAHWGTSDFRADFDNSGLVDFNDLVALLASWGECPPCGLRNYLP